MEIITIVVLVIGEHVSGGIILDENYQSGEGEHLGEGEHHGDIGHLSTYWWFLWLWTNILVCECYVSVTMYSFLMVYSLVVVHFLVMMNILMSGNIVVKLNWFINGNRNHCKGDIVFVLNYTFLLKYPPHYALKVNFTVKNGFSKWRPVLWWNFISSLIFF